MQQRTTEGGVMRISGALHVLTMCCAVGGGLSPLVAHAGGSGSTDSTVAEETPALRFQDGPCGLRSLRGQGGQGGQGGGVDLSGVWHCVQHTLLPARFRDTDTDSDSENPALHKKNGLKWGVRVRHDQVLVSVGLKW